MLLSFCANRATAFKTLFANCTCSPDASDLRETFQASTCLSAYNFFCAGSRSMAKTDLLLDVSVMKTFYCFQICLCRNINSSIVVFIMIMKEDKNFKFSGGIEKEFLISLSNNFECSWSVEAFRSLKLKTAPSLKQFPHNHNPSKLLIWRNPRKIPLHPKNISCLLSQATFSKWFQSAQI